MVMSIWLATGRQLLRQPGRDGDLLVWLSGAVGRMVPCLAPIAAECGLLTLATPSAAAHEN